MNPKTRRRLITLLILFSLAGLLLWGNTALKRTTIRVSSQNLPDSFDGFRIAHISDLHNTEFGRNNEKLLSLLRDAKPSIIAITGDMIDSRDTKVEIALEFAREAVTIAPCYYVTGNHESRVPEYRTLKEGLLSLGVSVLEDASARIQRSGESITVLGVQDPSFQTSYLFGDANSVMEQKLSTLMPEENTFTLLLSHRPELFEVYAEAGVDLTLSGHAHGGQFRIPFLGGLVAPNQGFFPEYDAGLYTRGRTNMVVSKGLGNSIIPLRINNRPEVVLIELDSGT